MIVVRCCKIRPMAMKYNLIFRYCSQTKDVQAKQAENNENINSQLTSSGEKNGIPEPPSTCCMTGCSNCVWLDYAENLTQFFKDDGEKAVEEINKYVTDANIKAYLMHELRVRRK